MKHIYKLAGLLLCLCLLSGCTESYVGYETEETFTLITKEAFTFSDGVYVNLWRPEHGGSDVYRLPDGTDLLTVDDVRGPANTIVGGVENFDVLNEVAQKQVLAFYEKQGQLYDIPFELNKKYLQYSSHREQGTVHDFQSGLIFQDITPASSNEQIMCFITSLTFPISRGENTVTEIQLGAVFDKETGAVISNWDLFSAPKEETIKALLGKANSIDTGVLSEMERKIKPEFITLFPEYLSICFPEGILMGEEYGHRVSIPYAALDGLMHSWAIPKQPET